MNGTFAAITGLSYSRFRTGFNLKHETSYRTRRIIGQLNSGAELIDSLTALCQEEHITAGQVRVSGALEHVELTHFDAKARDYKLAHEGGPAEIASLTGTIATIGGQVILRLDALLLGQSNFGAHMVTGQVRSAHVSVAEFVLEAFEDLDLVRGKDAETGRMVLSKISSVESAKPARSQATPAKQPASVASTAPAASAALTPAARPEPTPARPEPRPEPKPAPQAPREEPAPTPKPEPAPKPESSNMSWGEAIARSEKAATPASRKPRPHTPEPAASEIYADVELPDDEERPLMKSGDYLDHPKLGRCRVMKVEDDEEYAHVRLPRGKIRKLVLEIFEIQYKGKEDGRDVFALKIAN